MRGCAVFATVLLCLLLTACGRSAPTQTTAAEPAASPAPTPEEIAVTAIAITADNYEDYFEVRHCEHFRTDETGAIKAYFGGKGIFLKEAYALRYAGKENDIIFTVRAVRTDHPFDPASNAPIEGAVIAYGEQTLVSGVMDCRLQQNGTYYTDRIFGHVVAEFTADAYTEGYRQVFDPFEIIDVTGTLFLAEE